VSQIVVLPSNVADQIAAGEVVERPFSVVKELVENAVDAGATSVEVQVEEGGRRLIRVSDDGCGMDEGDALLCLARHATSKIRSASDLVGVRSFGFRGEALPAIASVSSLEIETATTDGEGVRISCEGVAPVLSARITRRRGTTVSVSSLFQHVPARLKFLRGAGAEWRAIHDSMVLLALTRLDLRLSLVQDGKQVLSLPVAASLRERVAQVWGAGLAQRLIDVDDVSGPVHTRGLVERPGDVGTATRRAHTIVNGRAVRDNGLLRAAEAAFKTTIPAGMRPSLFLHVTVPGSDLDVNVHPAKAEVRFHQRWPVERSVETAVRRALGTLDSGALFGGRRGYFGVQNAPQPQLNPSPGNMASLLESHPGGRGANDLGALAAAARGEVDLAVTDDGSFTDASPLAGVTSAAELQVVVPYLIQLHRTYLLFEREDGLVLIDQHSAHERVLYEKFLAAHAGGAAAGQRLLFPLTMHLDPREADAFEANRDSMERLGFEVEAFGGSTLLVRSVPMPHPRFDAEHCLRDTIAALAGDRAPSAASRHERLVATLACKAAVKAGEQLTQPEMRALYVALANTELPAHDVHGRAVVVHLTWEEVERRFGRR
jgi:DNA mismatch repair protein MutL